MLTSTQTPSATPDAALPKVGYVVKRYPRYSETFIVTEILAHEAAGLSVEIFALASPLEPHFQEGIARVRGAVHYLTAEATGGSGKASDLWAAVSRAAEAFPSLWENLPAAAGENGRDVHQALLLALAVRERGVGHLHAHFATSAATVARLAARLAGIPYTFTAHAKDIYHQSVRADDLRRKLRDAAAAVTVSDHNVRHLREHFGEAASRVVRVYNGMDLSRLAYAAPERRPPLVLAVGRLVEKKGFHVLLDACAALAARGREFRCQIIGTGDAERALHDQVERLELGRHVEFMGARPQEEVIERMRTAAVFAAPCVVGTDGNRDGLPTVLLEAMSVGTPCVSTDVTGIPEVVRHGETGLMVAQRDAAALADAVERLLADAPLRARLATQARQLVESQFDARRTAAQLRELFAAARASHARGAMA